MAKKSKKEKVEKEIEDKMGSCCGGGMSMKSTCGSCSYFLGFLGAVVYYVSTATGFWNGVWGVIKAMAWPAFLIFEVLKFVGA